MKILYPQDIFPSLWRNLESLINQGRLISPQEVFEELKKKDDELLEWAETYKSMFKNLDADPFVIALARCKERQRTFWDEHRIVVSEEKLAGPGSRPKIPDVCKSYGVECISLTELFRKENWQF